MDGRIGVGRAAAVVAMVAWGLGGAGAARAHEVRHEVRSARAVVVTLEEEGEGPLAGAAYEVRRPGASSAAFTGTTDAAGRVVFVPDEPGEWRVRAVGDDGHGVEVAVRWDAGAGEAEDASRPLVERHARLVTGVSLVFGLFGVVSLATRRRG